MKFGALESEVGAIKANCPVARGEVKYEDAHKKPPLLTKTRFKLLVLVIAIISLVLGGGAAIADGLLKIGGL